MAKLGCFRQPGNEICCVRVELSAYGYQEMKTFINGHFQFKGCDQPTGCTFTLCKRKSAKRHTTALCCYFERNERSIELKALAGIN